ncbi:hypothetical protein EMCRGX_G003784 [Ephydatia muelleri]
MPMSSVYVDRLYQQVIADAAEESMKAAVERGKESPHYATIREVYDGAGDVGRIKVYDGAGEAGRIKVYDGAEEA